jgi:hypothetical protein
MPSTLKTRPRLLTAILPDDNSMQVRLQDNVRCWCSARVRCFPREGDGGGISLLCDDGHDFFILERRP